MKNAESSLRYMMIILFGMLLAIVVGWVYEIRNMHELKNRLNHLENEIHAHNREYGHPVMMDRMNRIEKRILHVETK